VMVRQPLINASLLLAPPRPSGVKIIRSHHDGCARGGKSLPREAPQVCIDQLANINVIW
jgi:hypothetical protein